jgi:acetate kinase
VLVLVVNSGSSSLKLRIVDAQDRVVLGRDEAAPCDPDHLETVVSDMLSSVSSMDAVGHRVVHGGQRFMDPVIVDDEVWAAVAGLEDLAPLHNGPALSAIAVLRRAVPNVPQVACFDTAFHSTLPPRASTYALPEEWRQVWGLRRFGFHGLSHAWASRRTAELLDESVDGLRVVSAHIGSGASLAAVHSGRSVDTTMGFTPMDGLVMATRSGSLDPGVVLWVQRHHDLSAADVQATLERESGLLGLSGTSGDLRAVLAAADDGDSRAALAYEVYRYRLRLGIAAMVAALEGVDALVFTGGVGEHSTRLRRDVVGDLVHLGLTVDVQRNAEAVDDRVISPPGHRPATAVVAAREDLEIARAVRDLLARPGSALR